MTGDAPSPGHGPSPAAESPAAAAPLALYRRYRPASFAELKGQDHVTEPLRQALRSGRVNHAYLFSGPRGCGKTSSARILARSLNCEQGPTPDPCGVCASCVALAPSGPGSIDVIEIDAASHGGVDDARDLRERAFYAPVAGRFKIYIIDEAHMVTREGFNALLKLVEEPPSHLKFVFATTEPEKVIATIRSRTHHYPFRLVPPAVLRELLEKILASEHVKYEPAVLPVVIRAGAGSVRDSLSVLDQLIAGSDDSGLSYARAVSLLGYTDDRLLDEVVQAFCAQDGGAVFRAIDRVVEGGHDPRRFATDLLDRLRDLIVLAAVPDAISTGLLDVPADRTEEMQAQADRFGQARLTRAAEVISAGLIEMRGATSPRLLLELMCAQVLLPGPAAGAAPAAGGSGPARAADSELRDRLERLERRLESLTAGGAGVPAAAAPALPAPAAAPVASAPAPAAPGRSEVPAAGERPADSPAARPGRAAPASRDSAGPASVPDGPARNGAPARPAAGTAGPARDRGPAPAAPPSGAADADLLRSRWPEVLEAVRRDRKVAWILLTNATVASLDDGVLTIEFAREGEAKGFSSSGHDKLLGQVLQTMFGISPQIRAAARNPGSGPAGPRGGSGGSGPPAGGGGGGGSAPPRGPAGTGGSGGAAVTAGPAAPQASADTRPAWADDPPPSWEDPGEGWDPDDDPADTAAPVPAALARTRPGQAAPGGQAGRSGPHRARARRPDH